MSIVKIILLLGPLPSFSNEKSIFIGKGEQKSIQINNLEHYSLGNPEVLSKRLRYRRGKLLIKGKRVGFSDLIIWQKNRKKTIYHIYVLSKKESLKLAQASSVLEDLGLNLNFKGKILVVTGEIKNKQDLFEILKLKKIFKNQIILRTRPSKTLRSKIIAEVYEKFTDAGLKKFHCKYEREIECEYYAEDKLENIEKYFSSSSVNFIHRSHSLTGKNFILKLYFIQSQQSQGQNFSIGLNTLSSKIKDFISDGSLSLIQGNSITIGKHKYNLSTLAQPETKTILNQENSVQIGVEIANNQFDSQRNIVGTQWKEVGFNFKYKISIQHSKLKIQYHSRLSDQMENGINTSEFEGHQFIKLGKVHELLKASVITKRQKNSHLPLINNVPILSLIGSASATESADKLISIYYEVSLE